MRHRTLVAALLLLFVAVPLRAAPENKPIDEAEELLGQGLYSSREQGLEILEGLEKSKRVEELLILALSDEDWGIQICAAELLGEKGDKAARDALVRQAVEGEIQWVRDAAVRALGTLAPDSAGELLLDQTKRNKEDFMKARAVRAARPHVTSEHVRRLVSWTKKKDIHLAREGARALAQLVADPDARDSAMKAISTILGKRKDLKGFLSYAAAIEGLGEVDDADVRELLVTEVLLQRDDDGYIPERVGRALSAAGAEKASAAIKAGFAKIRKPEQARRLASLAGRCGAVGAVEQVEGLLQHAEERVRSEAARSLGLLHEARSVEPLRAALDDASWHVRSEAVTALAKLLPPAEFRGLAEKLRGDSHERVRLRYVVEVHDAMDWEAMDSLMPLLEDKTWRVASAAAATIGALGTADDMERLLPLLKEKDWRKRAAAYEGLGRLRAPNAIPLLAAGLRDKDTVVRGVCWTNLQILTSQKLKPHATVWLEWWKANGASVANIEKQSRKRTRADKVPDEKSRYGRMTRRYGVEILQKARILVITGAWDKVERVLEHLDIPHTLMRAQQLKLSGLNPNQILLVNCEGNVDGDTAARIDWFVNIGGYMMTTDWALTKTVTPIFPGFVRQGKSNTGNDVVVVEEGLPSHPLTAGVFDGVPALQWWLEIQAFPVEITYPERLEVIADSAEMRQRYGTSPMGFVLRAGLGKVQHSVSHFFLQEEGMQHATKPRDRMIFAADNLGLTLETIRNMQLNGDFDGRLTEEAMKRIAPDYSMFRLIVNFVKEKADWVENL